MHDLRSLSAKSAGLAIQTLSQCLGNDFETLALKLINKDGLIKAISNANKTLADIGHQTMLNILNHVCVPKIISRMQVEMLNSKSPLTHSKLSMYLFVIVSIYPFEGVLDKNAAYIDKFLDQCIQNANVDARKYGRKSFLVWQKLAPNNAQAIFTNLDYQNQKAIIEEQDSQQFDEPAQ